MIIYFLFFLIGAPEFSILMCCQDYGTVSLLKLQSVMKIMQLLQHISITSRNAHGLSDVPAGFLDNTYVSLVGGGADLSMENLAFSDFKIDGALGYLIEELGKTLWMQGTRLWTRQDLIFGIKILRHYGTMSEFLRVKQASIRSLQECQEINTGVCPKILNSDIKIEIVGIVKL